MIVGTLVESSGLADVVHKTGECLDSVESADSEKGSLPDAHLLGLDLGINVCRVCLVSLGVVEKRPDVSSSLMLKALTRSEPGVALEDQQSVRL